MLDEPYVLLLVKQPIPEVNALSVTETRTNLFHISQLQKELSGYYAFLKDRDHPFVPIKDRVWVLDAPKKIFILDPMKDANIVSAAMLTVHLDKIRKNEPGLSKANPASIRFVIKDIENPDVEEQFFVGIAFEAGIIPRATFFFKNTSILES